MQAIGNALFPATQLIGFLHSYLHQSHMHSLLLVFDGRSNTNVISAIADDKSSKILWCTFKVDNQISMFKNMKSIINTPLDIIIFLQPAGTHLLLNSTSSTSFYKRMIFVRWMENGSDLWQTEDDKKRARYSFQNHEADLLLLQMRNNSITFASLLELGFPERSTDDYMNFSHRKNIDQKRRVLIEQKFNLPFSYTTYPRNLVGWTSFLAHFLAKQLQSNLITGFITQRLHYRFVSDSFIFQMVSNSRYKIDDDVYFINTKHSPHQCIITSESVFSGDGHTKTYVPSSYHCVHPIYRSYVIVVPFDAIASIGNRFSLKYRLLGILLLIVLLFTLCRLVDVDATSFDRFGHLFVDTLGRMLSVSLSPTTSKDMDRTKSSKVVLFTMTACAMLIANISVGFLFDACLQPRLVQRIRTLDDLQAREEMQVIVSNQMHLTMYGRLSELYVNLTT